ncbi:MAG TPA: gamma-glutamyl-gamma-aminobutyrate hydrolase family protein [Planctomycetota bacterium]|nr:gamma-glutamyl-gamma-aminobutyrate hydrolase family protein [Planctomycetota bacterium]
MHGDTRPLIGLTSWTRRVRSGAKDRFNEAVPRGYTQGVEWAAGLPVLLPNSDDLALAPEYIARVDGLLLTGGDDVHPRHYGEAPHPKIDLVDDRRDAFEIALLRAARERGMPVLGICRGIQILNVALGGSLFQDIPSQAESGVGHAQKTLREGAWHEIDVRPGTRLSGILGESRVAVNSYHHQACRRVAEGLSVAATTADGLVEAVEDPLHPFCVAVQWHPEVLEGGQAASTKRLFASFVAAAREFRLLSSKGKGLRTA